MSGGALKRLVILELVRLWRTPAFSVPTLAFPAMFFGMFGLPQAQRQIGGVELAYYLLVSYSTFAVMSVGLFAFGASIAVERECGWSKLIRLAPVSPLLFLSSKLIVAFCFAAGSVTLLIVFAAATLDSGLNLPLIAGPVVGVLPGVITFAALGMTIGYLCPAQAAAAITNVVYVPLAFASGLFVPIEYLPPLVQCVAPFLPSYHLAKLGWGQLDPARAASLSPSILTLIAFTVAFVWLACRSYARERSREYV
jgi:ABC-2 type transport system permease protein